MNSFKAFVREKGLYLVCLALVLAAGVTGIWAVRSVVRGVKELTREEQNAGGEEDTWNLPDTKANDSVTDVPKPSLAPSALPSAPPSLSVPSSQPAAVPPQRESSAVSSVPQGGWDGAPVDGKAGLLTTFSGDALVYSDTLDCWRTHNGADYACEPGAQAYACRGGKVTSAEADALWGGVVEVTDADGLIWRYCGLAQPELLKVKQGDTVTPGEVLGEVDTVPSEANEGTHLHLECLRAGAWQDPVAKLEGIG